MRKTRVQSLGRKDPLEKEMAIHSSILAWKIPWTEEPVGYSPWGRKELDMTKWFHFSRSLKRCRKDSPEGRSQKSKGAKAWLILTRWPQKLRGLCRGRSDQGRPRLVVLFSLRAWPSHTARASADCSLSACKVLRLPDHCYHSTVLCPWRAPSELSGPDYIWQAKPFLRGGGYAKPFQMLELIPSTPLHKSQLILKHSEGPGITVPVYWLGFLGFSSWA